eukprot:TRINITY_DN376_c0_g1_i4.p1 TRINITY_DN376_c0_g1~~TRINITY_DN376_c0_g1_i4.p1  ORF type:complete len:325 (-),score=95.33 TRINITY_DN376_c0_g1_i4:97-1071(-)
MVESFHKLRSISVDLELIKEAVLESQLVSLNSPQGDKIKRTIPLNLSEDQCSIDNRTIYVEHIPVDSTHESLKEYFEEGGRIAYVSLPKFPSREIKGYAFIEYENELDAKNSISRFNLWDLEKAPNQLRVLSKEQWLKYKSEYRRFLNNNRVKFNIQYKHPQQHKESNNTQQSNKQRNDKTKTKPNQKENEGKKEQKENNNAKKKEKEVNNEREKIVRIMGIKEGFTRKMLREIIEDQFPVSKIFFKDSSSQAEIYVNLPKEAEDLVNARDNYAAQLGESIKMYVLQGEEENIYFSNRKPVAHPRNETISSAPTAKKAKHMSFE